MTYAYDHAYDDAGDPAQAGPATGAHNGVHVIENFAPTVPPAPVAPLDLARLDLARPDGRSDARPPVPAEREQDDRPRPKRPGPGRGPTRRRLGGLDGLRAVAVFAVVLFHLDFSLLPGGFLGVDVFFVISGFLITNLIATEILTDGRLHIRRFYLRRARRLLPTVFALLIAVTIAATTAWPDQLSTLRGGVLSSLTYVTNWWLIADHQPYFVVSGRPTMLQHLWSLAIEEQFYLVWTAAVVLLAGGVFAVRRNVDPARRLRVVVWLAIALALTSTLVMALYAESQDVPYIGSNSRVYYGSDTHTMGLFLGSAFGAALALQHARRGAVRSRRLLSRWRLVSIAVTDVVGLVALIAACWQFAVVDEYTAQLYRGGFLAFDAVVLVAVLCAVRPGSLFGRVLDVRPVRWIGQRSYSIYIWHWPVCVVTRPEQDVHGSALFINLARLALILGLSTLSYRFVEVPLRTGTWRRWRRRDRTRTAADAQPADPQKDRRAAWTAASVATTVIAALALAASPAVSDTPLSARPSLGLPPPVFSTTPAGTPHSAPDSVPDTTGNPPAPHGSTRTRGTTSAGAGQPGAPASTKLSISAFGDSVLLGAEPALRARLGKPARFDADAVEGRQASTVLQDIQARARAHRLRPYVLIHVGDNGPISPDQLRQTLHALADRTRVVLMTVRVPRDWQDINNRVIRSVASSFANVRVENWESESSGRSDWLYDDGIHLRDAGTVAYAEIVLHAFRAS